MSLKAVVLSWKKIDYMEPSFLLLADAQAEAIRPHPAELHTLRIHFLCRLVVFPKDYVQLAANCPRIGAASFLAVAPRRALRFCRSEQFHPLSHATQGDPLGALDKLSQPHPTYIRH